MAEFTRISQPIMQPKTKEKGSGGVVVKGLTEKWKPKVLLEYSAG